VSNIVIIGASYGIGKALAQEFAKNNNNLFLAARDFEALNAIKNQLKEKVQIFALDVTDENNVKKVLEKISSIDLFIYCAGTYKPMPVNEFDLSEAKK